MGKQSSPRRVADNEAQAVLRNLRVSPQKLNHEERLHVLGNAAASLVM